VIDKRIVGQDIGFFFICFAIAAGGVSLRCPTYVKVAVAILLVGAYAVYVYRTIMAGGESEEEGPNDPHALARVQVGPGADLGRCLRRSSGRWW
jgi:hypothetical protein